MSAYNCFLCRKPSGKYAPGLCTECGDSFDAAKLGGASVYTVIKWASDRTRKLAADQERVQKAFQDCQSAINAETHGGAVYEDDEPAPAPSASACQHRTALEAVLNGWRLGDSVTAQIGTVEAALAQPCAPSDAAKEDA